MSLQKMSVVGGPAPREAEAPRVTPACQRDRNLKSHLGRPGIQCQSQIPRQSFRVSQCHLRRGEHVRDLNRRTKDLSNLNHAFDTNETTSRLIDLLESN